jgi:hypothetical protein
MLTLLPKGAQTKLLKFFCLMIFSICHRCRLHRGCTLSSEYLCEFSKKFEMAVLVYLDAWGKLIHNKKPEVENLWHCPFKNIFRTSGELNPSPWRSINRSSACMHERRTRPCHRANIIGGTGHRNLYQARIEPGPQLLPTALLRE